MKMNFKFFILATFVKYQLTFEGTFLGAPELSLKSEFLS